MALSAAAVVLCAIGVGAWLFIQEEPVIAGEEDPSAAVALAVEAPADPAPPADAVPAAAVPTPTPAPAAVEAKPAAASQSKPNAAARSPRPPAPAAKAGRTSNAPVREAASAPAVEREAPAPAPVVRKAAAPAEPAAPVGPFFELKDVNESPRVATRVEPRLPSDLRGRKINEMIIVRALVSQTGHPSRVSILRRSKTGHELDDVVVAAVNQWTFSPARKKGEPVSCWFNFGVPIGDAE